MIVELVNASVLGPVDLVRYTFIKQIVLISTGGFFINVPKYDAIHWVSPLEGCGLRSGNDIVIWRVKYAKNPARVILGMAGEACMSCKLADSCVLKRFHDYRSNLPVQTAFVIEDQDMSLPPESMEVLQESLRTISN